MMFRTFKINIRPRSGFKSDIWNQYFQNLETDMNELSDDFDKIKKELKVNTVKIGMDVEEIIPSLLQEVNNGA